MFFWSAYILLDYNDVFADVINVCVFGGNEIIKANDLESTSVHSEYKAADGMVHEEERDIAKYWKQKKSSIALYGIENQSEVDYTMPFRIIGYDGASYRSQILEKNKTIVPVASFVLYFGTKKRWTKKQSIKDCMKVPEELDPYVNDYKIHVIEIAWLSEEQLKLFKSDFGIVANFFVQKRKNKNYVPDDKREIQHVDAVLKLLSVMTKDDSYRKILYDEDGNKAEVKTMCEVADRLKNEGKSEGRIEGRNEGRIEGRIEGIESERMRAIKKKIDKNKSKETIADELELSVEEVEKYIQLIEDDKCNS